MTAGAEDQSRRPQRIAVITSSYPAHAGDAAGHFVETEVRELVRGGHRVSVFAPGHSHAEPVSNNPQVLRLGDGGAFGWPGASARIRERPTRVLGAVAFTARSLRALAHGAPFERIVAHFLVPCGWPIATLAHAFGCARALEVVGHGSDVRLVTRLPRVLRLRIARAWIESGARVRLVSRELRDELVLATLPALRSHTSVEPSPIDVGLAPSRNQARSQLGIDASTRLVVLVTRLVPGKRVDVALRALALVPNTRTIVVGDGPLREELERRYAAVTFTGTLRRTLALAWIAAADAVVSASRSEGAPSVIREARLLGVPVVTARAGDLESWAACDPGIVLAATQA
jgi:teichuronic acid biosynthesis glycosyltransferase TuaC